MSDPTKIRVVSIEALMDMWEKDAPMSDDIEAESRRIPILHQHYRNLKASHTLMLKKVDANYKKEYLWYWRYYMGKPMDKDEVEKRSPEIGQNESVLKTNVDAYIQGEDALIKISMLKAVHAEIVDYCTDVLKELSNRTYQLKTILEDRKYMSGK